MKQNNEEIKIIDPNIALSLSNVVKAGSTDFKSMREEGKKLAKKIREKNDKKKKGIEKAKEADVPHVTMPDKPKKVTGKADKKITTKKSV